MVATLKQLARNNNGALVGPVVFGASATSEAIDCTEAKLAGLLFPSAIASATSLTFTVSDAEAGTYRALYDDSGNAVTVTVAASRAVAMPIEKLAAWPWVKLVLNQSQSAGTEVLAFALPV